MKLTIPHILLLALLVLASCKQPNEPVTITRGSISGIVLDQSTDTPIIGAEVRALINEVADTTDDLGMFLLDNLESGADTLMITGMRIDTHYHAIYVQPDDNEVTVFLNSILIGDIVFSSNRTGAWEVYRMDFTGANQVRLTHNNFRETITPKFSPDGSKIYFDASDTDPKSEIIIMNRDGSDQINLTDSPESETVPLMSPDGQYIVYTTSSQSVVSIMNSDGSNQRVLTENFHYASAYAYSPAGDIILCVGSESSGAGPDIFLVPVDGSAATNLTGAYDTTGAGIQDVHYSPDAMRIVFSIYEEQYGSDSIPIIFSNIFIMEADGTNLMRLTSNARYSRCLGFSLDNQEILYTEGGGDGGYNDLLIMGIDSTNVRNITNSSAHEGTGQYIDGSHIVYEAEDGVTWEIRNYDIYIINEVTGIITQLTDDPADDRHPDVFMR